MPIFQYRTNPGGTLATTGIVADRASAEAAVGGGNFDTDYDFVEIADANYEDHLEFKDDTNGIFKIGTAADDRLIIGYLTLEDGTDVDMYQVLCGYDGTTLHGGVIPLPAIPSLSVLPSFQITSGDIELLLTGSGAGADIVATYVEETVIHRNTP